MGNIQVPGSGIFGLDKKGIEKHPGLVTWKNGQRQKQEELKKSLQIREMIRAEYIKEIRDTIQAQNFAGDNTIQVIPEKKDPTVIYIQSKDAKIQLDMHYNEGTEARDSLRKNTFTYPYKISLTGDVEGELYLIDDLSVEDASIISGEILKHIERKKNPKIFGYTSIHYGINQINGEGELTSVFSLVGKRESGKIENIPFFEELSIENRITIYGYMAHYFGAKIGDEFLRKNKPKPTEDHII